MALPASGAASAAAEVPADGSAEHAAKHLRAGLSSEDLREYLREFGKALKDDIVADVSGALSRQVAGLAQEVRDSRAVATHALEVAKDALEVATKRDEEFSELQVAVREIQADLARPALAQAPGGRSPTPDRNSGGPLPPRAAARAAAPSPPARPPTSQ